MMVPDDQCATECDVAQLFGERRQLGVHLVTLGATNRYYNAAGGAPGAAGRMMYTRGAQRADVDRMERRGGVTQQLAQQAAPAQAVGQAAAPAPAAAASGPAPAGLPGPANQPEPAERLAERQKAESELRTGAAAKRETAAGVTVLADDEFAADGAKAAAAPAPADKLHASLRELAARVEKEGKDGSLTAGDVLVKDYKVDVMVRLSDTSAKTLEALKTLGFELSAESKAVRLVIGSIDVRKLEELVKLEAVVAVNPVGA